MSDKPGRDLRLEVAPDEHLVFLKVRLGRIVLRLFEIALFPFQYLLAEESGPQAPGNAHKVLAPGLHRTPLGELEPFPRCGYADQKAVWGRDEVEFDRLETVFLRSDDDSRPEVPDMAEVQLG